MSRALLQLAAALLSVAPTTAQTYSLRGYLVDGLTNRPITGARIHLFSVNGGNPIGSNGPAATPVVSDESGRFAFTALPAGGYAVQAELAREVVFYEEDAHFLLARTVSVGPQFESREITIRILPPGELTGALRDESGEIVPESGIAAYRRGRRGARIELIPAGNSRVDEHGRYRVTGLRPGDYTVCAVPPERHERYLVPMAESTAAFVASGGTRVYTQACESGIHVASGEGRQIDLILRSSESVTVRSSAPAELFRDDGVSLVPERQPEIVQSPTLRYDFPETVPGHYMLESRLGDGGPGPYQVARRRVVVSNEPVQDFEIRPERGARIDVSTRRDDGIAAQKDDVTVEWLTGGERLQANRRWPDPVFMLDPGAYWLAFRARASGCAVSATLGGSDVLRGPITLLPGMTARLEIVWSTLCGSVRVHGAMNDQATSFATYLLLLSGTPQEPGDALIGTLDVHGDATIGQLPPGRYRLWTWMNDANGYVGPDLAVAPFDTVEVTSGRTASITVTPGARL